MKVKKCVIPTAGYATRLYPASRAIPKALLPVVDRDGRLKPIVHLLVREAVESGFEEVILVVKPGDEELIGRYFHGPTPKPIASKPGIAELISEIEELGERVRFAFQEEPRGFGHAVLCARELVGDEPFAVSLGDHLYRSHADRPCMGQVADVFERYGVSVTGLEVVGEEEVERVGVARGEFIEERVLRLEELKEKPPLDYARRRLRVRGVDGFLGNFGIDILTPAIFEILERMSASAPPGREVQLRDAMDELIRVEGMLGYIVSGERFDLGEPFGYMRAVVGYGGFEV